MPHYDLESIVAAAKSQRIIYGGRKVGNDIYNLGYTINDVAHCIEQLQPKHYQKTEEYSNAIFDFYKTEFSPKLGQTDLIFMKLRLLTNNDIFVSIGSFHL
jgi:hypothetical protein